MEGPTDVNSPAGGREPLLNGASISLDAPYDEGSSDPNLPSRQDTIGTIVRMASKQAAPGTPVITSPLMSGGVVRRQRAPAVQRRLRNQVMISCFIMFAEGYYATQIFPYVAWMAGDLRHTQESVGFYSGLLYTCQSAGMLSSAVFWANLSNRHGRRVCLLTGLAVNMVVTAAIAFCTDYWVTFAFRLTSGFLNCNLPIMRTALRESFYHEDEDDTSAFSTLSVAFGASCVAGPALGGIFYGKVLPVPLFEGFETPWMTPMLCCTLLYAIALVVTANSMPETAFLSEEVVKSKGVKSKGEKTKREVTDSSKLFRDPAFLLLLINAGGHSYVFTGWELVYPLLARVSKEAGGEAWSTAHIGVTFLVGSVGLMIYSLAIYPKLAKKMPVMRLWIWSWVYPAIIFPLFPRVLTRACRDGLPTQGWQVQLLNYGTQLVVSVLLGSGFISIQLLMNVYVSKLPGKNAALALANSWMVSTQAFVRAVSPMCTGSLFSIGMHAETQNISFINRSLPFDSLTAIGLVTGVFCGFAFEKVYVSKQAARVGPAA